MSCSYMDWGAAFPARAHGIHLAHKCNSDVVQQLLTCTHMHTRTQENEQPPSLSALLLPCIGLHA